MGMVEKRPTAEWQCAPLVVSNPGSLNRFRLTIDTRPVNDATVKEDCPMPHLESEIAEFSGAIFFASIYFIAALWKLRMHPEYYEIFWNNCAALCRSVAASAPRSGEFDVIFSINSRTAFLGNPRWHEGFLRRFQSSHRFKYQLPDLLEKFFWDLRIIRTVPVSVKGRLFKNSLKWCGKVVGKKGYNLDPHRLEDLRNIQEPKDAAELAEFLYCCRWMTLGIPDSVRSSQPLTFVLEKSFQKSRKRTKRSIKCIFLCNQSWGHEHSNAYEKLQDSLRNSVGLSFLRKTWTFCVHTDTLEELCSGVVTQIQPGELQKIRDQQKHEPLAFVVWQFNKTQLGWTTFEK